MKLKELEGLVEIIEKEEKKCMIDGTEKIIHKESYERWMALNQVKKLIKERFGILDRVDIPEADEQSEGDTRRVEENDEIKRT